jgi:hypothetical protein
MNCNTSLHALLSCFDSLSVLNNHIRSRQLCQGSWEVRVAIYLHTVTLYTASRDNRTAVSGAPKLIQKKHSYSAEISWLSVRLEYRSEDSNLNNSCSLSLSRSLSVGYNTDKAALCRQANVTSRTYLLLCPYGTIENTRSVCQVSVLIFLWTNLKCSTLLRHTSA